MYKTGFVMKVLMSGFVLSVFLNPAFAEEKSAPERINQGPDAESGSAQGYCQKFYEKQDKI